MLGPFLTRTIYACSEKNFSRFFHLALYGPFLITIGGSRYFLASKLNDACSEAYLRRHLHFLYFSVLVAYSEIIIFSSKCTMIATAIDGTQHIKRKTQTPTPTLANTNAVVSHAPWMGTRLPRHSY